jgi:hypothetical protein
MNFVVFPVSYKAIHTELDRVLKGHVVPGDVSKYWCRKIQSWRLFDG